MTDATFSPPMPALSLRGMIPALFGPDPRLAVLGAVLLCSMIPTGLAMLIDPRLFQGESIWLKPLKFEFALAFYLLSLAFFARFLPAGMLDRRGFRIFSAVVILCILGEVAWIGGAAMFGTASHFNLSSPVMEGLYGLMGLFAVTLTSASLVYGIAIWRNPAGLSDAALRLSVVLGLVLTFLLTVVVAGYMSSQPGHLVGVPITDARVPVMGWSREVGDLRLPHFLATHAMHVIPLAGLVASRMLSDAAALRAVWAVSAGFVLVTLAGFAMAIMGLPVFPV
ncbi:hypothetical protein ACFQ3C_02875 [Seohaeicola saemankumensis]|uniref:Uncharacterized protein n=1 Tax=Seohaeicola saemankumensis TaxID=481181 RepID=A0ABW3T9A4_9RHOB